MPQASAAFSCVHRQASRSSRSRFLNLIDAGSCTHASMKRSDWPKHSLKVVNSAFLAWVLRYIAGRFATGVKKLLNAPVMNIVRIDLRPVPKLNIKSI